MARRIQALGVAPARTRVIANWCDDETIRPLVGTNNPLREAWHLIDKFVVAYSGNLGRAHDFETMLAAAERLRDNPWIVFLVIGGGKGFDDLVRAVKARRLEHAFRFRPYQERAQLPYSLGVADVHWLSLHPGLEGLIVPSKFYAIAAAGKPIVMIGDDEGEVGRLVREHRCGITIAPGDAVTLADTLRRWSEQPRGIAEMGAHARQMLDARFTRRRALDHWRQLIEQLCSSQPACAGNSAVSSAVWFEHKCVSALRKNIEIVPGTTNLRYRAPSSNTNCRRHRRAANPGDIDVQERSNRKKSI